MAMFVFRDRSRATRSLALMLASLLLTPAMTKVAFAQTAPAAPAGGDAKTHRAAGDAAAKSKDWQKAVDEYSAANAAEKTPESAEGIANAQFELGHFAESYDAYDDYLNTYSAKLAKPKKDLAQKRLKDLGDKTGAFAFEINEAGADVFLDDKDIGKSPLTKPVRVLAGPHRVRVTKAGFLPYEQAPNAVANGSTTVAVKLEADARKAHLNVREQANQQVHVFVDGVDVGAAPWSGDLDAGEHEITVKSTTLLAAPQKITIGKGETRDIVVAAATTTATLKVQTADGKGLIYLDDKVVGEGLFSAEIPAGLHKISVKREGYDAFDEEVTLKEKDTVSRSVTLSLSSTITTGTVKRDEDRLEGFYFGFGLSGAFMPAGNGNDIQEACSNRAQNTDIGSCKDSGDLAAAIHVYAGYHWDPIGIELFLQPMYDQTTPTVNYNASTENLNADPARTENFAFRRIGAALALRARYTFQTPKFRAGFAAGPGLSYRQILFQRDTTATVNGDDYGDHDIASTGYLAPALSLDIHAGYRISRGTELQIGFQTLFESPRAFNTQVAIDADNNRQLVKGGSSAPPLPAGAVTVPAVPGQTIPVTTPSYQLMTGTQAFTGFYLGMQFGP